jgi:cysteinyl-tRNA synthetase
MMQPPMANFWMHGGLLHFDNRKMSKSIGNFEPLYELLERHDAQAIRLLFLQTGYSKVMNFTEESIAAASVALDKLKKTYRLLRDAANLGAPDSGVDPSQSGLMQRMESALDDDMNTSVALSELLSYREGSIAEFSYALDVLGLSANESWERPSRELSVDFVECLRSKLAELQSAGFGLSKEIVVNGASAEEVIQTVISVRSRARANKDFTTSDRLRDLLLGCGVTLNDSKDGTTWSIAE